MNEDLRLQSEKTHLHNVYIEKFKHKVGYILDELREGRPAEEIDGYLSKGENAYVFKLELEGDLYAVRISQDSDVRINRIRDEFSVNALIQSLGVEKTAQLVAFSLEDGVIITKLLEGTDLRNLLGKFRFTRNDLADLIESLIRIDAKGLSVDGSPGNFIYSEGYGFSLLDLHIQDSSRNIFHQLCDLPFVFLSQYPETIDYVEYLQIALEIIYALKDNFPDLFGFVISENQKMVNAGSFGLVYNMSDLITKVNRTKVNKLIQTIESHGIKVLEI